MSQDLDRLRRRLSGTRFGDVRWVAQTGSTNADVLELARQGDPEGIVVVADHQTAGRGRRGRGWDAPAGASLMATVLLRPPAAVASLCTMAVGLAAVEAIAEVSGPSVRLKWPNDLVWPGDGSAPDRKLAGILAEAEWPAGAQITGGWSSPPEARVAVAVGIGINVAWGDSFPADLVETAVALDEITDPDPAPDRADLLVAMLEALEATYQDLLRGPDGAEAVMARWRARSATLGRRVRVDLGVDDVEGTAVDVTPEGHLVVETPEGGRRVLAVGDVVHLRPSPD